MAVRLCASSFMLLYTGVARYLDWGAPNWKKIGHYFDNVFRWCFFWWTLFWWRHWNNVTTIFLNFDFVIIILKKHNLAKSRNFRLTISKVKGRWGRRAPSVWRFLKICY